MHLSPDELIDIQISVLFISDTQGRLRYIREPGYEEAELDPAPRFFMGRTLHSNIWRFRYDLSDAVIHAVDQVCRNEPIAVNLIDPPHQAALCGETHNLPVSDVRPVIANVVTEPSRRATLQHCLLGLLRPTRNRHLLSRREDLECAAPRLLVRRILTCRSDSF
jgi:hypothetical protein